MVRPLSRLQGGGLGPGCLSIGIAEDVAAGREAAYAAAPFHSIKLIKL